MSAPSPTNERDWYLLRQVSQSVTKAASRTHQAKLAYEAADWWWPRRRALKALTRESRTYRALVQGQERLYRRIEEGLPT